MQICMSKGEAPVKYREESKMMNFSYMDVFESGCQRNGSRKNERETREARNKVQFTFLREQDSQNVWLLRATAHRGPMVAFVKTDALDIRHFESASFITSNQEETLAKSQ